jgi:hypothetical protein
MTQGSLSMSGESFTLATAITPTFHFDSIVAQKA